MKISIIGGTGAVGRGLARRWARAGHEVVIGSRDAARAADCARALSDRTPGAKLSGADNASAAAAGELVVLAVPFAEQRATLDTILPGLGAKILIDVTVPLVPPKVATVQLPEGGSAVVRTQKLCGEAVRVVSAFQNVSAKHLDGDHPIDCDVLVTGNDPAARQVVIDLVRDAGMRGLHAGPLANSAAMEALTSVLIWINRHNKIDNAGIRITGIPI